MDGFSSTDFVKNKANTDEYSVITVDDIETVETDRIPNTDSLLVVPEPRHHRIATHFLPSLPLSQVLHTEDGHDLLEMSNATMPTNEGMMGSETSALLTPTETSVDHSSDCESF